MNLKTGIPIVTALIVAVVTAVAGLMGFASQNQQIKDAVQAQQDATKSVSERLNERNQQVDKALEQRDRELEKLFVLTADIDKRESRMEGWLASIGDKLGAIPPPTPNRSANKP